MPASQIEIDATAVGVETDEDSLRVRLADGREIVGRSFGFRGSSMRLRSNEQIRD